MKNRFSRTVANLLRQSNGVETVEYAIITGLVVLGTIVVIAAIAMWILGVFESVPTR